MKRDSKKHNWIIRGGWALVDQGLFAAANVLLNVLLARCLTAAEYGAFAVAYSLFLFIGAFHTAFITEPLLLFGSGKFGKQVSSYRHLLLRGHWYLTLSGSLLLVLVALCLRMLHKPQLSFAIYGLAIATPFSLMMWLARRAAYLNFQTRLACFASAFYALLILIGISVLSWVHAISIFSAMLTLAVAGGLTGFGLWSRTKRFDAVAPELDPRQVVEMHWRYGRWACATAVLMWVPLNLFFAVLSIAVNLEASATLKALSNLVLPVLQANAALGTLLLPLMVSRVSSREQFSKLLRISVTFFAALAVIYSLFIGIFGRRLVGFLYGGQYEFESVVLALLLIIPLLDGLMMVLANALRAYEMPDRIFWSNLAIAIVVLTVGVYAATTYGLWGAAASIVAGDAIGATLLAVSLFSRLREQATQPALAPGEIAVA